MIKKIKIIIMGVLFMIPPFKKYFLASAKKLYVASIKAALENGEAKIANCRLFEDDPQ